MSGILFEQTLACFEEHKIVLGESVFDAFAKSEPIDAKVKLEDADSFLGCMGDLGLDPEESSELPSSSVDPMFIHASTIESVFNSSVETPMFAEPETWDSLFGEVEPLVEVDATSESKQESPASTPVSSTKAEVKDEPVEQESSLKLDEFGCVSYNRKRRRSVTPPLETVDPSDSVAVKRAKNTEAARRSRARKMQRMAQLEDICENLTARNRELEAEVSRLRSLLG